MEYVWVITLSVLLGTNFLLAQNQGSSSSNPSWDPNPQFGNGGGGGGGGGQSGNSWGPQNNGWSNPSSQSSNSMMEAANMAAMMSLAGMGGNSGGGSMGGMGGLGGLGGMAGMMNPMSLMLSMQASRMGDNFNPNPPEVVYTPNQCPSFTTFRQCQINPCPVRCKRFPTARCVTNPCGGCAPEWYQGGNRIIDCD